MSSGTLRAGAAQREVTPGESLFLYGYPHVQSYSEGTHDPLFASALGAAQEALELQDGHYDPWRALAEVAAALGNETLAAKADRKAQKLQPRLEGSD